MILRLPARVLTRPLVTNGGRRSELAQLLRVGTRIPPIDMCQGRFGWPQPQPHKANILANAHYSYVDCKSCLVSFDGGAIVGRPNVFF